MYVCIKEMCYLSINPSKQHYDNSSSKRDQRLIIHVSIMQG